MAVMHVDASGSNTAPYETWTKAATALATAAGAAAAGDTIYVSTVHTEATAGQTITFTNGTAAAPIKVICGVKDTTGDNAGISSLATTTRANIESTTSGSTAFVVDGYFYASGLDLKCSHASSSTLTVSSLTYINAYENCRFLLSTNSSTASIKVGFNTAIENSLTTLIDCQFSFGGTDQELNVNGRAIIRGGSLVSGSSAIVCFSRLGADGRGGTLEISGFDFSNAATGVDIFEIVNAQCLGIARNCKMPASWSGEPTFDAIVSGGRAQLINCDSGDTNYKFWFHDGLGSVKNETTIVRTSGGAQDEATKYSMRMATNAGVAYPGGVLRSPPIIQRLTTIASARTATVEIVHDGASAMTDKEIWLEVEYLGTSGTPLALFATDKADFLTTASAQASSSEAWDGDTGTGPNGSATWNTLKLVATFTAQEVGYVIATVCVAKPSWTVFVDPKMAIASAA